MAPLSDHSPDHLRADHPGRFRYTGNCVPRLPSLLTLLLLSLIYLQTVAPYQRFSSLWQYAPLVYSQTTIRPFRRYALRGWWGGACWVGIESSIFIYLGEGCWFSAQMELNILIQKETIGYYYTFFHFPLNCIYASTVVRKLRKSEAYRI